MSDSEQNLVLANRICRLLGITTRHDSIQGQVLPRLTDPSNKYTGSATSKGSRSNSLVCVCLCSVLAICAFCRSFFSKRTFKMWVFGGSTCLSVLQNPPSTWYLRLCFDQKPTQPPLLLIQGLPRQSGTASANVWPGWYAPALATWS